MKTKFFIILALFFLTVSLFIPASKALAQKPSGLANIQYPIKELGSCKNESDCKIYCDKPDNTDVCLAFAEKNNLMSKEEVSVAKKFLSSDTKGPGGCKNKDACEVFCDDMNHMDECISFAEKNNLIPLEKLEEAKKVQAAIKRGFKPPPCGNKEKCDIYCDDPEHMEECITFGIEAGFIQGKELEDVQKMLQAVKRGVKPPPCKGKQACDEYCSNPDNMEICMNFAMEAGFMSEEEKANSQKMLQALKKGIKPPNCKGKEECDAYCSSEEHFQECINFSVAAGMMSEEEAQMAKKTGGKGPGGCKGKEECDAFCNNPDNQQTCFEFGRDNGMIPEEDLKRMEEGKQQMKQTLEQAPSAVLDCFKTEVGADIVEKMKSGFMPPRDIGEKMGGCFQKMGTPGLGKPGEGGMIPPAGQTGPGGCKTAEECTAYCESHQDECQKFQPGPGAVNPGDQIMPQQAGPGGCKTPDECQKYCESNPEECKNFQPNQNQQPCQGENCQSPTVNQLGQPCQGDNCPPPPQNQVPCQGENCQPPLVNQLGQPCQGDNCPPPSQNQVPCQGDNCPPPSQNQQPCQGENCQPPPAGTQPGGEPGQQPPAGQQPPSNENPPPPASFLINPDSLAASVIHVLFIILFNR